MRFRVSRGQRGDGQEETGTAPQAMRRPHTTVVTEESGQVLLEDRVNPLSGEASWTDEAFREVFLEHYGRVTAVLYRLVSDPERAEELANDVFWRLYHQRLAPSPDGNPGGWLYRTATHLGIDALRADTRRKRYEQAAARSCAESGAGGGPLDELLRAERRGRVRRVLASLRPAQAQLLILRVSGFSYKELAEILKLRAGSVGTMLIRAEAEFRKRYVRLYGKEEVL